MPETKIEKLIIGDTRPETTIQKLNELIDAFNNHWHVSGREQDNTGYAQFWGHDEPRNEVSPDA